MKLKFSEEAFFLLSIFFYNRYRVIDLNQLFLFNSIQILLQIIYLLLILLYFIIINYILQ